MDRPEVFARVAELLADILDVDAVTLEDGTTADDMPGWDSIAHVKLIIACEGEFGVRFSSDEATAPENVGAFIDLIMAKMNAQ